MEWFTLDKRHQFSSALLLILLIGGCNMGSAISDSPRLPAPAFHQGTNVQISEDYPFSYFKLEADVENEKIIAEYKDGPYRKKALYKNMLLGIHLTGEEAMEELNDIFSQLRLEENSSDAEVKERIFSAFHLTNEAERINVEIEFRNGEKKKYSF